MGISRPNARSMLLGSLTDGACTSPVVRLVCVHLGIEQDFNRQWYLQGDEEPLQEPSLCQWEVVGVALCRLDAIEFEHDHNAKFISTRVVLPYDASLPQAPHVRDLLREVRFDHFVG